MTAIDPAGVAEASAASEMDIASLPRIAIQAFCLTSALTETIEAAKNDRRLARVQIRVQMGGIAAAIEAFREAPTPNLILVEFRLDEVETLPFALDELASHCDPDTRVVVIGPVNDVPLYREVIRRGVSDYLVLPLAPLQLIGALSELYRPQTGKKLGRCVAFMSAKGGCGSSTLAHNTAWIAASRLMVPTILVDCDLPFGSAALNFNQDPLNGLADILFAEEKPDPNMIDRTLCKVSDLLSLLASVSNIEKSFDINPNAFDDIMDGLRSMVPLTILDLPHQWTGWVQRAITACDDLVIIAEPDLASLRNTKQIIDQAARIRSYDRKPVLVLNKVSLPKRPEIPADEFFKPFAPMVSHIIGFDAQTFGTAANNGQMVLETGSHAALDKVLHDLARFCAARTERLDRPRKNITDLFTRLVAFRR